MAVKTTSSSAPAAVPSAVPPIPAGAIGDDLVSQINDRIRRLGSTPSQTTQVTSGITIGVNKQTGTTYAIKATDAWKLIVFTNPAGCAVAMPNASTMPTGFHCWVQVLGVGNVTFTPSTSTIDGLTDIGISQGQGFEIFSDGTNYYTERGLPTTQPYHSYICFPGTYGAGQVLYSGPLSGLATPGGALTLTVNYLANLAGSQGIVTTVPASPPAVFMISFLNPSGGGTWLAYIAVSVSSTGVVTFASTTGPGISSPVGAFSITTADIVTVTAPTTADVNVAGFSIVLAGWR